MRAEGILLNLIKRLSILLMVVLFGFTMCACNSSQPEDPYKVLKTLEGGSCYVVFRQNDKVGEWVTAAMQVLAADGTMATLSNKWFGTNQVLMQGDKNALDGYDIEKEARSVIIGVDPDAVKMTGGSDGDYRGFDIDLAEAVCELLGWESTYREIDAADAKVELNAGQVDIVWCGFSDASLRDSLQLSPAYLKNDYVIVSRSDSEINRFGKVAGTTVGIVKNSLEYEAVLTDMHISNNIPEKNMLFCSSQEDCFDRLNADDCAVIVVNQRLLEYHNEVD